MYRRSLAVALAASAFMFAGAAAAQQTSVGVSAGTTGLGLEFGYDFSDSFGLRTNGNWLSFSKDVESDGINYDGKLKLFTLGGTPYTPAQIGSLNGRADFNEFTPYAGLGFTSNRGNPGLAFVFDAGVMFQGRPEITLAGNGPVTASPTFQADLERERQEIADDLKWTRFYPAVRLGVAYRF